MMTVMMLMMVMMMMMVTMMKNKMPPASSISFSFITLTVFVKRGTVAPGLNKTPRHEEVCKVKLKYCGVLRRVS
jgi:hypothetical protein